MVCSGGGGPLARVRDAALRVPVLRSGRGIEAWVTAQVLLALGTREAGTGGSVRGGEALSYELSV